MATVIFNRRDFPSHLFEIPELDFSEDILVERLSGLWFRLGAWTIQPQRDIRGVENVIERQTIMLSPGQFSDIYDKLESVGNVIDGLGKPGGSVQSDGKEKAYSYAPFHRFNLRFTSVSCEPLVFPRP